MAPALKKFPVHLGKSRYLEHIKQSPVKYFFIIIGFGPGTTLEIACQTSLLSGE